ncbi:MAG: HDOD domain-containing protein, partial [Chromatiaceae bacterium]|nr:HDOD domain-containing protein [Chromatiaceae bacterium]
MRETAQELRRLLGLHSTRNQELQRVLLSDPAAAIAVFRRLEQARPGACEQVTDAAHAVSLIGLDPFRHLLDALPEIDPGRRDQAGGNPAGAYSEAAHAAFYAGALSDHKGLVSNQEIPTAALLQNPAVLALWTADPEAALRAHNAVRDGVSAEIAFGAELGEPLEEANRRLATAWAFPQLAQQAMRDREFGSARPRMVRIADNLARTTSAGWQREDTHAAT